MMEQETDELLKHADSIKAYYGEDVLKLTTACRYVERLLANARIHRYLTKHHEDTRTALEQVLADTAGDKQRRPDKLPRVRTHALTTAAAIRKEAIL